MNNIVNLSPWAARATEVTADPALARFSRTGRAS
jgi:hypothetical protein